MKILKFLPLFFIGLVSAHATGPTNVADASTDTGDFSSVATVVQKIITFVSYLMWAVSSVFIALAGFKLKQGDIPGFAKTLIGGAAVFCSPFLIEFLYNLATSG